MRKLFGIMAVAAFFVAGTAQAAPVSRTVVSTLSITIQGLDSITVTNTGSVSTDSSGGVSGLGSVIIGAGLVSLSSKILVPVTATSAIASIRVKAGNLGNQSGTMSVSGVTLQAPEELCSNANSGQACDVGGEYGGQLAITGIVSVIITPKAVTIPVDLEGAGLGVGGSTNSPFTFDAAPWTNGTGLVYTPNAPGGVGLFGTGTHAGNSITFVTPTYVNALGNLLPLFTVWEFNFPEPGTLMLLGAGVAGLVVVGRRRR